MNRKLYVLYDAETGEEYSGTCKDLAEIAGVKVNSVYAAKSNNSLMAGRYTVSTLGQLGCIWTDKEIMEWNEYYQMFRRVRWTSIMGPGVKVLYGHLEGEL